jgi:hypothetical protein
MVRTTTSDVRITSFLQQTAVDAKTHLSLLTIPAGATQYVSFNMTYFDVEMVRHNVIAAEMPDTGNASSYVAIELYDGTNSVTLKKVTGTAPSIYWDGPPIIDKGYISAGLRSSSVRVALRNAGTAAVNAKVAFQVEKLA